MQPVASAITSENVPLLPWSKWLERFTLEFSVDSRRTVPHKESRDCWKIVNASKHHEHHWDCVTNRESKTCGVWAKVRTRSCTTQWLVALHPEVMTVHWLLSEQIARETGNRSSNRNQHRWWTRWWKHSAQQTWSGDPKSVLISSPKFLMHLFLQIVRLPSFQSWWTSWKNSPSLRRKPFKSILTLLEFWTPYPLTGKSRKIFLAALPSVCLLLLPS